MRWSKLQYVSRALQVLWVCLRNLLEMLGARGGAGRRVAGPQRLRALLEELGGSFLKFGQILSLQIDTLPREYCDALLNLLDRVPAFGREDVRRVFYEELGQAPEDVFREFNYSPLASASIGQVHRAVLPDGATAAVKVQRPGVRELFHRDAVLLNLFVRIIFALRIRTLYFLRDPVREFNTWIEDELDYRREAAYGEVLGQNARETPTEHVPRIHWHLTTSRILTMDFLKGYTALEYMRMVDENDARISDLQQIGFEPAQFLSNVIQNFLSDAFRFGIFHADLHPANLLILKDNVVGYVDFGIVGHLTPEARRKQIQLSMAYASGRTEEIYEAFLGVSSLSGQADLTGFRRELEQRTRAWYREPAIGGVPHLSRSLTTAMFDLLTLCRGYGLLVDREMIKYIRSLILVDGLVTRLAPGLDLAPQIRKVCEGFYAQEAQGRIWSRGAALSFVADLAGWLHAGPAKMLRTLERLERREVRVRVRMQTRRDSDAGLWPRGALLAGVWFAVALVLLANGVDSVVQAPPLLLAVVAAFWGGCIIWMLRLLSRLAGP